MKYNKLRAIFLIKTKFNQSKSSHIVIVTLILCLNLDPGDGLSGPESFSVVVLGQHSQLHYTLIFAKSIKYFKNYNMLRSMPEI